MTDDINKILATKCDWRKAERRIEERRKKYGTPEERKTTADVLRAGRDKNKIKLNWFVRLFGFWRVLLSIVFIMIIPGPVHAYTTHQAILAVIGEAEGESQIGKEAIACAIHYRGTLQGVYGLHAYRVRHHKYSNKVYKESADAVWMAEDQEACEYLVNGAQYWASTVVDQQWINTMIQSGYVHTVTIGQQAFFRKD